MRRRFHSGVLAGLAVVAAGAGWTPATARETKARHETPPAPVTVLDVAAFQTEAGQYVGKLVHVNGCYITSASSGGADCAAFRIADLPGKVDWNGSVPLDGPTMEDASFRKAQQICGDTGRHDQCRAEVSGDVYDPFGDMGVQGQRNFELRNVRIHWLAEPATQEREKTHRPSRS
ncbi:hypothetical protein [Komagataeibacter sp. FNDCR2]|uniref:hypothetical protein n=1 Tax=Komagataeibacter sp. FNDCR2 TaxID=2878682 RepID=UPI001E2D727B|nr:hypothetical protein [Komagataeibacter sp. FNDCR2]